MAPAGYISFLIIIATCIVSIKGFRDKEFYYRWNFDVEKILVYKQYKRIFGSGFLHANWIHLVFNMLGLLFFSGYVEAALGPFLFTIVYFASMLGGKLFSLFIYRNQGDYTSVGASGAICGIVFASIALFPGMSLGLFLLPISIPGWLFGLLFVLYSVYGIRSRSNNIGHESHLGGALIGMLVSLMFKPSALVENYITILIIAIPTIIFIYLIIVKPHLLLVNNLFYTQHKDFYSIDHKYNYEKKIEQKEIDNILDKISRRGMQSLTKAEKEKLKRYSETAK
jgi:membrane associated rhomboid family serine protease